MYAYKTNSADYLDYVASLKSRQEILADPDLCPLLENIYIKDNMEVALLWNKAKYGDYQDKYDFLEYFFCNGPELDADTILHYRMKAFNDPVCMEIAYSYLSDTQQLSQIRKEKYKKQTDDCFKNPCFYLGKFSAMMGNCGDIKNTKTAFNMISNWAERVLKDKQKQIKEFNDKKQGKQTSKTDKTDVTKKIEDIKDSPQGSNDKVQPKGGLDGDAQESTNVTGARSVWDVLIPQAVQKGIKALGAQLIDGNQDFTNDLMKNYRTASNAKHIGDWMATPVAEMLDLVTKANVRRQLGDCGRLWSQVRRLRLFTSDNHYGPITADQIISNTNTDGTPQQVVANTQPTSTTSSKSAANARKQAKAKDKPKSKTEDKDKDKNNGNEEAQYVSTNARQTVVVMSDGSIIYPDDSRYKDAIEYQKNSSDARLMFSQNHLESLQMNENGQYGFVKVEERDGYNPSVYFSRDEKGNLIYNGMI